MAEAETEKTPPWTPLPLLDIRPWNPAPLDMRPVPHVVITGDLFNSGHPPPLATCSRPSGRYTSNWNAFFIFKTIFVCQWGPIKNLTCKVVFFYEYFIVIIIHICCTSIKHFVNASIVLWLPISPTLYNESSLRRTSRRCTSPSQVLLITEIFASNLPNLY